jgi:hypothetical protein
MRIANRLAIALVFGACSSLASCGASSGSNPPVETGGSSGSGGTSTSSGSSSGSSSSSSSGGGPSGPQFTVSGALGDGSGNGVAGASVCIIGAQSSCTTTDSGGNYTLAGVWANKSGFIGTANGFAPTLWPLTLTGNLTYNGFFRSSSVVGGFATQMGTTFGPSTGAVFFVVFDGNGNALANATVTPSGAGTIGYFNADGSGPATTLTKTTANGGGYIFQIAPGNVNLTVSVAGLSCGPAGHETWTPSSTAVSVLVPVQAGALTVARIACQ